MWPHLVDSLRLDLGGRSSGFGSLTPSGGHKASMHAVRGAGTGRLGAVRLIHGVSGVFSVNLKDFRVLEQGR